MPRKTDPVLRAALIEIGARLLDEEGPQALSTRRIAAEAGSSTMPVYTYFGGMSGLVREMGEYECGFDDVADLAGAGGDVVEGSPAAGEDGCGVGTTPKATTPATGWRTRSPTSSDRYVPAETPQWT